MVCRFFARKSDQPDKHSFLSGRAVNNRVTGSRFGVCLPTGPRASCPLWTSPGHGGGLEYFRSNNRVTGSRFGVCLPTGPRASCPLWTSPGHGGVLNTFEAAGTAAVRPTKSKRVDSQVQMGVKSAMSHGDRKEWDGIG
jgi:hypothetical protein